MLCCDKLVCAPDIVHEALRAHGGLHTVMVGSQLTEDFINKGGHIFSEIASAERKAAFVTPYKKYVTSGSCRHSLYATIRDVVCLMWLTLLLYIVSKYGNRNVTTRTNDLLNPRLLAASTSVEDEKAEIKKVLDDLSSKERSIHEEVGDDALMSLIVRTNVLYTVADG